MGPKRFAKSSYLPRVLRSKTKELSILVDLAEFTSQLKGHSSNIYASAAFFSGVVNKTPFAIIIVNSEQDLPMMRNLA